MATNKLSKNQQEFLKELKRFIKANFTFCPYCSKVFEVGWSRFIFYLKERESPNNIKGLIETLKKIKLSYPSKSTKTRIWQKLKKRIVEIKLKHNKSL